MRLFDLSSLTQPLRIAGRSKTRDLFKEEYYYRLSSEVDIFVRRVTSEIENHRTKVWLLHGAGMDSAGFDIPLDGWSFMELLAERGYDVFAMDYRGHGLSSRVPNGRSVDAKTVANDCSEVIQRVNELSGESSVHLVGESFGTIVAPLVAKRLGTSVASITLMGAIFSRLGSVEAEFLASVSELEGVPCGYAFTTEEEWSDLYFGDVDPGVLSWHRLWYGTAYAYPVGPYLSVANLPIDRALINVTCPVLVIIGSMDPFASKDDISDLFRALGEGEKTLRVMEGIGHLPYVETCSQIVLEDIVGMIGSAE